MENAIIGGGIGGLTLSIALSKTGVENTIFEKSNQYSKQGAGIILAQNATNIYNKLGLYEDIAKAGSPVVEMNICDPKLNPLAVSNLQYFEKLTGVKSYAIHRSDLLEILTKKVQVNSIQFNKTLKTLKQNEEDVLVEFEDKSTCLSKYVFGADGIHSVVRDFICEDWRIRKSPQICVRGICDFQLPQQFRNKLHEAWGRGKRFGFVQINETQVYWYAVYGTFGTLDIKTNFDELFSTKEKFHPLIHEIFQETIKESLLFNPLSDIQINGNWFNDRVCLIGDAAHAATPNLGQGACQAIEDAYCLANLMNNNSNEMSTAFNRFQSSRKSKVKMIVNTSWKIGNLAQISNPVACYFRNTLLKYIPSRLSQRQNEKILLN